MKPLIIIITVFFVPSFCFAWGFETHIFIGTQILQNTSVEIIKQNQAYFLCGNIFPDMFNLFRDFSRFKKELPTHSWATVSKLFANCESEQEKAFAYGYSAHLSADVIAHNHMVPQHIAYLNSGRMRSHLLLEMAEESVHLSENGKQLSRLLKFAPGYGSLFLRCMGINADWFAKEARTIRLGVISQKHLKMHHVTAFIKKRSQPDFEERMAYFREAALRQAYEAVEKGFSEIASTDPSGRTTMAEAKKARTEMLQENSKKELRNEFNNNLDQRLFNLKQQA